MPLSADERAALTEYVNSPEGKSDREAVDLLASEMRPASAGGNRQSRNTHLNPQPTGTYESSMVPGPSASISQGDGPSRRGLVSSPQPSVQRAQMRAPTDGKTYPLPNQQAAAWNSTGAAGGAALGGMAGTMFAPGLGTVIGAGIGGALGSMNSQVGYSDPSRPATDIDPAATTKAGLAQAGLSAGFGLAGRGLVRLGFPRIGGFLAGTPPQQAVSAAAPQAARGVSTPALQAVDTAAQLSPQAGVQAASSGAKQAAQSIPVANAADAARGAAASLQPQLAQGARDLAPLNKNLATAVQDALAGPSGRAGTMSPAEIQAAVQGGQMSSAEAAQRLMSQVLGDSPASAAGKDIATQAFRRPNAFPATAGSDAVAQARIPVAAAAAQQGMRGSALGQANDAIAAATAKGIQPGAGPQLSADAQGLSSISKLGPDPRNIPVAGKLGVLLGLLKNGDAAGDVARVNFRGGPRAAQTVSALLADRGAQSAQPLSQSQGFLGGNALDAILTALTQNRSRR